MLGLLTAAVLAGGGVFAYWHGKSHSQVQAAAEAPVVYLRNDFTASVLGKSEDEVLEAIGKPDDTSEDAQAKYWHYRRRTKDPATGRTDSDVQVVFERGRVIALNF